MKKVNVPPLAKTSFTGQKDEKDTVHFEPTVTLLPRRLTSDSGPLGQRNQ
jgi:hypothetical protein